MVSEINPNPQIYLIPRSYRNVGTAVVNVSENVNISGFPTVSYKSDVFNTWLAQNSQTLSLNLSQETFNYEISQQKESLNQTQNLITGLTNAVSAGLSGNVAGSATSAVNNAFSYANSELNKAQNAGNYDYFTKLQMAQVEKQKLLPDNVTMGSTNTTLIGYNYNGYGAFMEYCIKPEFMQKIDKYFDMYRLYYKFKKSSNNWKSLKLGLL